MKNIVRILPFILILTLSGCDFLKNDFFRRLAGRPEAVEVEQIREKILAERQAVADSIEALRQEAIRREAERTDSLAGAEMLSGLGIRTSSISRFGTPSEDVPFRYNAVIGVFRQKATAESLSAKCLLKGYNPYFIFYEQGVRAVCLCGSDTLSVLAASLASASYKGDCPKGTWVYIVNQ